MLENHGRLCSALLLTVATWPAATLAAQSFFVTGVMPVRMEILVSCTVSASALNFGAYTSGQSDPASGQTTIELRCAPGTSVEIALDAGEGAVGNTRQRQMKQDSGTDRMNYDLYSDSGFDHHWGDGRRDTVKMTTEQSVETVTVYGAVPGRQWVRDGNYSDTIIVTVYY